MNNLKSTIMKFSYAESNHVPLLLYFATQKWHIYITKQNLIVGMVEKTMHGIPPIVATEP